VDIFVKVQNFRQKWKFSTNMEIFVTIEIYAIQETMRQKIELYRISTFINANLPKKPYSHESELTCEPPAITNTFIFNTSIFLLLNFLKK